MCRCLQRPSSGYILSLLEVEPAVITAATEEIATKESEHELHELRSLTFSRCC